MQEISNEAGRHPVEEAFILLYPEKSFTYIPSITYSGKFKDYNANVRLYGEILEFRLCKKWKHVAKEIQLGLIQELMLRLFNDTKDSLYVDLYNNFVRKLHVTIPKTKSDPVLAASFQRVNERYFLGLVEQPNLVWGHASKQKLGSYNFKSDTITISKVFLNLDPLFLDYVMYHEMLHKHHSYKAKGGRVRYHTAAFRRAEKAFQGHEEVEKALERKLRYLRMKQWFC